MVRQTIADLRDGRCNACLLMGSIVLTSLIYWTVQGRVNPSTMNDLVDGPLMLVSFLAGFNYLSWVLFNCHKIVDRAFLLRFGICLTWIGNGVWRVSRFLYAQHVISGPIGAHDAWRGYMILLMTIGGVCHIVALDMVDGRVKTRKAIEASLAVSSGFVGMLILHGILL